MYDTSLQRQIPSFAAGNTYTYIYYGDYYVCVIIFLFVPAVFDLIVGVRLIRYFLQLCEAPGPLVNTILS
jgi:hypothetical protein